jgi:hypothetical protein
MKIDATLQSNMAILAIASSLSYLTSSTTGTGSPLGIL